MAAAVWCSCPCLRSWSRSWKLSPLPTFKLWSGSSGPDLHRQRWWTFLSVTETGVFAVPRIPFIDRVMDIPVVRETGAHGANCAENFGDFGG